MKILILILILIMAIIAYLVNAIVNKGNIKNIIFYFITFGCVASAVKGILGEWDYTLIESFWDIGRSTYINYSIMMAIVLTVLVFVNKVVRFQTDKFVVAFVVSFLIGIVLVLGTQWTIDNVAYCVCYAVSVLIALGFRLFYKHDFLYVKKEYKNYVIYVLPAICALTFMAVVYLPVELYVGNVSEFSAPFWEYFSILLIGCMFSVCLIVGIMMILFPRGVIRFCVLVVSGITILGYLQMMFLNGKLDSMNGNEQGWSTAKILLNAAIWIGAVVAIVLLGYFRETFRKVVNGICIYIFLIQVCTLGYLVITNDICTDTTIQAMTTEGSLELSGDNNILVFLLDAFDSSYFDDIIDEDESFTSELSDFTYYANTTSEFAHTSPSVTYLLNVINWDSESGSTVANDDSVLDMIGDKSYNIGVYTENGYLNDSVRELAVNYSDDVEVHCDVSETLSVMIKTSAYKMAPFIIKPLYEYYSSDISGITKTDNVWSIDDDLPFYESIISQGLSLTDGNVFRLYHMRGPHAPFYLNENFTHDDTGRSGTLHGQARASMRIVYEYMAQMKKLGIYDSATIIITADHGQTAQSNTDTGEILETSSPIMLIKKPYETNDEMMVSYAPVSQNELFPEILEAAGINHEGYGRTFEEIAEDEERTREYIDLYMDYLIQYEIDGYVKDSDSWKVISAE